MDTASNIKFNVDCFKDFIDVYGNEYNPIDSKLFALKDYRYQIVIENTKRNF